MTTSLIIEPVIAQHAEEASFLWLLRDEAVHAPHYSLKDLAALDTRVEAHIDGLRIAHDKGWAICKTELSWNEPGEVFAASVLALDSGDSGRVEEVVAAGSQDEELARGLISALGWVPFERVRPLVRELLGSEDPMRRRIGIGACAVHRSDPNGGLPAAQIDAEPVVRTRALRAVGELGARALANRLTPYFDSDDPDARFWAAWSAALLGDPTAVPVLLEIAAQGGPHAEPAIAVALRKMKPEEARSWRKGLNDHRLAVISAGVTGDPADIDWLIETMADDELARSAGEAVSVITGVDLALEDLEGEWPEGFEAGPTERPEDEDVAMDPDEDLAWPEPELLRAWWHAHRGDFVKGTRYLLGSPVSKNWLREVLRTGNQRHRAAAALELAIQEPGRPLFEVRAPGFRQQKLLANQSPGVS